MSDVLVIHTKNLNLLTNIYNKKPETDETIAVDNTLNLTFLSEAERGKGFGGAEMAISVVVSLAAGVASGIVANMIYDKIMEKGKNRILIKEKRISISTKEELIEYVEKSYYE